MVAGKPVTSAGSVARARLFTRAGYLFASVNYRLSPSGRGSPAPDRVRFPDHPHDVGEALGWLRRNGRRYGGDAGQLVLIGHSAGAHLASLLGVDPSFGRAYGVPARTVRGVVSLDTAAFDVAAKADPARSLRPQLFWNAFGTPQEEAAEPRWASASPIGFAGRGDPPFLLVTQRRARRVAENAAMLRALGRPPQRLADRGSTRARGHQPDAGQPARHDGRDRGGHGIRPRRRRAAAACMTFASGC